MSNKRIEVIAEAGVNHNGDVNLAKRLIEAASDAGADVVKFQTFRADLLVLDSAPKANYQINRTPANQSQLEMLKALELTDIDHRDLMSYCQNKSIEFLSTGFDRESIDLLISMGQARFKIPSGEINNLPYLRYIGGFRKPVILSTGMANFGEIESALSILENSGTASSLVTVLHCTSEYPCPVADVNLLAMLRIREAFGVKVGYSDHTEGVEIAIAAAALGAVMIEKHITLDKGMPGPDHAASLNPSDFKLMVDSIRNIELGLGDGVKRPTASEIKNIAVVRKSIVAISNISAGEVLSEKNTSIMRPGTGLSPMLWDQIIGLQVRNNVNAGSLIRLEDIDFASSNK